MRGVTWAAAMLASALVVCGCGSSPPQASAGKPRATSFGKQFLAFAGCMRAHGLPGFPDPQISTSGREMQVKISPGGLNPNSPAFAAATRACRHLLPNGGAPRAAGTGASVQEQAQGLKFADCLRSHGVPNFPDPERDGTFNLPSGLNPQAPQVQRAMQACKRSQPSSLQFSQAG